MRDFLRLINMDGTEHEKLSAWGFTPSSAWCYTSNYIERSLWQSLQYHGTGVAASPVPRHESGSITSTTTPEWQHHQYHDTRVAASPVPRHRSGSITSTTTPKWQHHQYHSTRVAASPVPRHRSSSITNTTTPKWQHHQWLLFYYYTNNFVFWLVFSCVCAININTFSSYR